MDVEEPRSPETASIRSTVPPVAIRLMAIAARISSVFRFSTKNASRSPMAPPAAIVSKSPAAKFPVIAEKITPNSAEKSIMPSNAILVMPDLEATEEASAAKRIGVVARRMALKKSGLSKLCSILCHLPFF